MYFPCLVFPYQRVPGLWKMPESVFTHTIPLLFAGGVCCCALVAFVEGEGVLAGVLLAEGVPAADVSVAADFLVRLFFAGAVSPPDVDPDAVVGEGFSAAAASSAFVFLAVPVASGESAVLDFLERLFFVLVSAAVASADFPEAAELSLASDLFERFFFVVDLPPSAGALSAASADFLALLFLVAGALLSAVAEESLASALLLFFDRLFFVAVESSVPAELSALAAELFFLDFDFVLLPASADASERLAVSSGFAFFLLFFFVVVELSL